MILIFKLGFRREKLVDFQGTGPRVLTVSLMRADNHLFWTAVATV